MTKRSFKKVLAVDWLEARFTTQHSLRYVAGDNHALTPKISLEEVFGKSPLYSSPNFDRAFIMYFDGIAVGCLNAVPNRNFDDKNLCRVRIDNTIFYSNVFRPLLQELFCGDELKFKNFIRLDIAFDTDEDLLTKFHHFYQGMPNNLLKTKGIYKLPRGGKVSMDNLNNGIIMYKMHGGLISLYNKTRELEKSGKDYQREYFEANGLGNNVYRMEIKLDAKRIRDNKLYIDGKRLHDVAYLTSLFNYMVERRATFRTNTKSNASREAKIRLVDIVRVNQEYNVLKSTAESEQDDKMSSYVIRFIKMLLFFSFQIGGNTTIDDLIKTIISKYGNNQLAEWLQNYSGINMSKSERSLKQQFAAVFKQ